MQTESTQNSPEEKSQAADLYAYYKLNTKVISLVSTALSFLKGLEQVELIDAKIKNRRTEEEQYLHNDVIREKLRRGNSIVKLREKEGGFKYVVGRKGLVKFFDIRECHINHLRIGKDMGKGDYKAEYQVSIQKCVDALKDGNEVRVYFTEKANGENAQVSYVQEIDCWLVSSKNVSVAFKEEKDIDTYSGERFQYAKDIARAWINVVKEVTSVEDVKKMLAKYCAVGEYCGNDNLQHFVKYKKETIFFYALVDKTTTDICMPLEDGFALLKQLKLPTVNFYRAFPSDTITTKEKLAECLGKLSYEVATSSLESLGEGSVLYLSSIKKGSSNEAKPQEKVIALGKLKTLEYRIFRKMREKLKSLEKDESVSQRLKKFNKEVNQLIAECLPENTLGMEDRDKGGLKQLTYYEGVATKAVKIKQYLTLKGESFHSRFRDFLDLVRLCYDEKRDPNKIEIEYLQRKIDSSSNQVDEEDENQEDDIITEKSELELKLKISTPKPSANEKSLEAPAPAKEVDPSQIHINILVPMGMVDIDALEPEVRKEGFNFDLKYDQTKTTNPIVRLIKPEQFTYNPSNIKAHTFLILPSESLLAKFKSDMLLERLVKNKADPLLWSSNYTKYLSSLPEKHDKRVEYIQSEIEQLEKLSQKTKKIVRLESDSTNATIEAIKNCVSRYNVWLKTNSSTDGLSRWIVIDDFESELKAELIAKLENKINKETQLIYLESDEKEAQTPQQEQPQGEQQATDKKSLHRVEELLTKISKCQAKNWIVILGKDQLLNCKLEVTLGQLGVASFDIKYFEVIEEGHEEMDDDKSKEPKEGIQRITLHAKDMDKTEKSEDLIELDNKILSDSEFNSLISKLISK